MVPRKWVEENLPPSKKPDLVSIQTFAKMVGIPVREVLDLIDQNKIPHVRLGESARIRIRYSEIEKFLANVDSVPTESNLHPFSLQRRHLIDPLDHRLLTSSSSLDIETIVSDLKQRVFFLTQYDTWMARDSNAVYFVTDPLRRTVKIGTTHDLRQRLRDLQHMSPEPLTVLLTIVGGVEAELFLHQSLARIRLWGEWFLLTNDVLRLIAILESELFSIKSSENTPQFLNEYLYTVRIANVM